jgi:phosphoenolpyruvate carboxylase
LVLNRGRLAEEPMTTCSLNDDLAFLDQLLLDVVAQSLGADRRDLLAELIADARAATESAGDEALDAAAQRIADLDPPVIRDLLKALTLRFHLVNKAEQVEIIRINRDRARAATRDQPRGESIAEAVAQLHRRGWPLDRVLDVLARLDIQPTLTAHPTEARRRSVLRSQRQIAAGLQRRHDPGLTESETRANADMLRRNVLLMFATDEVRAERPQVINEVRHGLYFLSDTIWNAVPRLYRDVRDALATYYDSDPELPRFLRYRSWIGGDRDGNPRVTNDVTRRTFRELRQAAIDKSIEELTELRHELSLSARRVPIPDELTAAIAADRACCPLSEADERNLRYEPYRLRIVQLLAKLRQARDEVRAYTAGQFIEDLALLGRCLEQVGLAVVAAGRLRDLRVRAETFGLHFAALDIRQHSAVHTEVLAELLRLGRVHADYANLPETEKLALLLAQLEDPRPLLPRDADVSAVTRDLLDLYETLRQVRQTTPDALGSYIVSMTHHVSDLLGVLVLFKEAGLWRMRDGKVEAALDLVPLFETIDDLERAPGLLAELLEHPLYAEHLRARDSFQEIMLGYSDSSKDGGFWMSNWALRTAQKNLAAPLIAKGVDFRFFHGRGGTVGRGGGRANRAILANPPESRNGRIRFTEQGEIITFRYDLADIARRHLEQIVHAMMIGTVDRSAGESAADALADTYQPSDTETRLMGDIARHSMAAYRALVEHPDFWSFYTTCAPIEHISQLPIASRPVARTGGAVDLNSIRAIPWVFAWTQTRYTVPGWYGLGSGIAAVTSDDPSALTTLRRLYGSWSFFHTVIDNARQEMARARLVIAQRYASFASRSLHELIRTEFGQAERCVLAISEQDRLLDNNPVIQGLIAARNPHTDVLNLLQIELLRRDRQANGQDEEVRAALLLSLNGIAAAMQSTG